MVAAFLDDEEIHLEAMVNFITRSGLDDELREHDWRGFARGYNGAGYEKNGYHTKLAAAYAKWSKISDTPWQPDAAPVPPPPFTYDTGSRIAAFFKAIAALFQRKG